MGAQRIEFIHLRRQGGVGGLQFGLLNCQYFFQTPAARLKHRSRFIKQAQGRLDVWNSSIG